MTVEFASIKEKKSYDLFRLLGVKGSIDGLPGRAFSHAHRALVGTWGRKSAMVYFIDYA